MFEVVPKFDLDALSRFFNTLEDVDRVEITIKDYAPTQEDAIIPKGHLSTQDQLYTFYDYSHFLEFFQQFIDIANNTQRVIDEDFELPRYELMSTKLSNRKFIMNVSLGTVDIEINAVENAELMKKLFKLASNLCQTKYINIKNCYWMVETEDC